MVTIGPSGNRSPYVVDALVCPITKIGASGPLSTRRRVFPQVRGLWLLPRAVIDCAALALPRRATGARRLERGQRRRLTWRRRRVGWFDLGVLAVPSVRGAAREWTAGGSPKVVTLSVSAGQRLARTGKVTSAQEGNSPHLVTVS